ncbi:hypothetical protein BK133_20500 [Paenibacillus sp. FSL H8-0548]|uniref:S-layer homology domain-containing protein n=1 Tax=Paenibacillus sp. FSL H8-0548 TaxID=1920422 RepID=UPI00096F763F|nr:S-layer homology domain-containing protein [Paenibacillus sp. FSL H8-0548]OMF26538.1 hypothetical protein BK133_20500 [Paenibacillus sp. FSL H8-0548]
MGRKLFLLSLSLLICFVCLPPFNAYADGGPSFALTSTKNEVTLGSEIQITVAGNNLTDVYGYEISLDFDQAMLEYKGVKGGLSDGFSITPLIEGNHLRFASTKLHKVAGESGALNLATITFKAIKTGSAALQLNNIQLVDSQLAGNKYTPSMKATVTISTESSGGSNPGGTGTVVNPPDQSVQGIITLDAKLDSTTKTATAVVNQALLDKAIEQVASNEKGVKKIQVRIKEVPGATAYELELPTAAFAGNGDNVQVEVISPLGTVLISNKMFKAGEIAGGSVRLRIAKADMSGLDKAIQNQIGDHPILDISLYTGDKKISWSNPLAPVTVSIPYAPNAEELKNTEHIVIWYVSEEGQVIPVPNGRYDAKTGTVVFTTTHLSKYAVAYIQKTFDDIASLDWAKKKIEVLASKGIINGISDKLFAPRKSVTRADFLVLLMRTLELDASQGMGNQFADVKESDYYSDALRIARGLGIAEGKGNNLFMPHESITREDMMVLTERTLRIAKQLSMDSNQEQLSKFNDRAKIADYAVESVAALVQLGLVQGDGNAIQPKGTTNRAQAAVLMYNIYNYLHE